MPRFDIFAKRKLAVENAEKPVIFVQNRLPQQFRVQVVWILRDLIEVPSREYDVYVPDRLPLEFWQPVRDKLAAELGRFYLERDNVFAWGDCLDFILQGREVDDVLSLIELIFHSAENEIGSYPRREEMVAHSIDELNHRFLENSIGYQYQSGRIISVESQYVHQEIVEPAIALLHDANFNGPLQEFMDAHAHYRKGEMKDAITDAGNAFESTMKAICDARGWNYDKTRSVASTLIGILFDNQLIPQEMQSHFTALRATLEGGVPTVRNPAGRGAHGQGITPVDVPDYVAQYCLNLTASNIVLMMEAHNSKPLR